MPFCSQEPPNWCKQGNIVRNVIIEGIWGICTEAVEEDTVCVLRQYQGRSSRLHEYDALHIILVQQLGCPGRLLKLRHTICCRLVTAPLCCLLKCLNRSRASRAKMGQLHVFCRLFATLGNPSADALPC